MLAEDLQKFEIQDIEVALDRIGRQPRQEGETAFPDLPTLTMACRGVRDTREASRRLPEPEGDYFGPNCSELFGDVLKNFVPKKREVEVEAPITHRVTVEEFEAGWFHGSCSCGARWDTYGKVEVCPKEHSKAFREQAEASLAAFHEGK